LLWSETLDQPANDALGLRDQGALRVAGIVRCALEQRAERTGMADTLFRLYVHLCAAMQDPEKTFHLMALTGRILEADPESPRAWALHAAISGFLAGNMLGGLTRAEAAAVQAQAVTLATRSLEADPRNPLAHTALAVTLPLPQGRAAAERRFQDSLATGSADPWVLRFYARMLRQVGRNREAAVLYERVLAVDPLRVALRGLHGWMLAVTGHVEEGRAALERAEAQQPGRPDIAWYRLKLEVFHGEPRQALALLDGLSDRLNLPRPERLCFHEVLVARAGGRPDPEILERNCAGLQGDVALRIFALLGDLDRVFAIVADQDESDPAATIAFFYPETDAWRRDPRFWPVAARFGLSAYWLETGRWPDFCTRRDMAGRCPRLARQSLAHTTAAGRP